MESSGSPGCIEVLITQLYSASSTYTVNLACSGDTVNVISDGSIEGTTTTNDTICYNDTMATNNSSSYCSGISYTVLVQLTRLELK